MRRRRRFGSARTLRPVRFGASARDSGSSGTDEFREVAWSTSKPADQENPMTSIQPIASTPDLPRLRAFYETVLGAKQTFRVPEEGPEFYVELRIGASTLGLVQTENTEIGAPVRIILSADVADVAALLPTVEAAGGTVPGPANDMPWGQRVAHVLDPDGNMLNLTRWL
jgi:predicted enzyme related to lactoylglutathione lyase